MRPMYDKREPQPQPSATREPLVDLDIAASQPKEPRKGFRARWRRPSDNENVDNPTPPQEQGKPQSRPTLAGSETHSATPQSEAQSQTAPRRPSLVAVVAAPEGQERQPRAERPRLVTALSSEDLPGLQTILDPRCSASGRAGVEQPANEMCSEQNLSLALVGGLIAALVGAAVWALLAMATGYYIGWMAVGVGFLVGGAVRFLGRGVDRSFGRLGLALSVFGCLLGNLLSICMIVAGQDGLSTLAVLTYIGSKPAVIPAAMVATFHALDPLFYGVALYAGYRLSFRRVADAS